MTDTINGAANPPGMTKSPELQARELLDDAARVSANDLQQGNAALGHPVGMGLAPHLAECRAAADRIVGRFGGAVLKAIEGEAAIAKASDLRRRLASLTPYPTVEKCHSAAIRAVILLELAEDLNANCPRCEGHGVPELCGTRFPAFDEARVARRLVMQSLAALADDVDAPAAPDAR